MKLTERMRWDRTRSFYIEPVVGRAVKVSRTNWIVVGVQIMGGVKRVEEETGCLYEHIIQWMEQGFVNTLREAEILAKHSRLPLSFFPVGCDSSDM